jgi:hypothetical protein
MPQSVFDILKKPDEKKAETQPQASRPSWGDYASAMIPQPVKTTVGGVFDLLTRPVASLAGAALAEREGRSRVGAVVDNLAGRRKDSFMDVAAKDFGEDSFTGKALGFAGDMVADPLNLAGGAIPKAIRAAAPAAKAVGNLAPDAVQRVAAGVRDALGEKFVPRYGTAVTDVDAAALAAAGKPVDDAEAFRSSLRSFQKERSTIPVRTEKAIIDRYKGTDITERDSATGVLEALEAGAGKTQKVDDLMLEQKRVNDELFEREVRAGVQKPEAFNPDYAPHDYSRSKGAQAKISQNPNSVLNARNSHARKRVDPERTIQEAVQLGAADDAALAQLTREIKGERAALTGEFVQKTAARFGLPVDQAPVDWEVLKLPMEKPLAEQVSAIAVPSYIAREINKLYIPEREATMLGKIYDKTLRLWRTQATVLRPGFHSTNMQGNAFNGALLAGALHPGRYLEAATWNFAKAKGFPNMPNVGRYTAQQVDDYMERFGVGGAGHSFTNELMEEGADAVLLSKLEGRRITHRNPLKQTVHVARETGQKIEDFSKRALFFDRLHKGDSLEQAAAVVDKFLFDYSDLTDFERRVARRIMPFYTWSRKNIPLQVEQLLEQPGKYSAVAKSQQAMEREPEADGSFVNPADRLEYLQRNNAVQIGKGDDGAARFWTPYLPFSDLNKIPVPGGSDPLDALREVGAGIEPLSKTLIELGLNKSLFFNRPIFDADLGPVGDKQQINDVLKLLPEGLQKALFTEVQGKNGPEMQTPALVRYGISQFPLVEGAGKAAHSITQPEAAANPHSWKSPVLGLRITERDPQQVVSDRKAAQRERVRIKAKERKQAPRKADVKSLYERYKQTP